MKKFLNGLFIFLSAGIILAGIGTALFNPVEINEYENRYAQKLEAVSLDSYRLGEFQDKTEAALADQLPFAIEAKKQYNSLFSKFNKAVFDKLTAYIETNEEISPESLIQGISVTGLTDEEDLCTIDDPNARYYTLPSGRLVLKDHLMYATRFLDDEKPRLDKRIANINEYIDILSDYEFYVYYIEKETDNNFVTGECSQIYKYLRDNINADSNHIKRFRVKRFEDFDQWFYRTDHHFNCVGGLECYKQVLSWLLPEETALEPSGGPYEIGYYSGSKASGSDTQDYRDINACYSFDYPQVATWENGNKINYYGSQDYFLKQMEGREEILPSVTYGQLFGQDSGEIRFENSDKDTGSILVFGESMDNAILRLLASHYSKLYSIDLRNYQAQMGKSFNIETYLQEHSDIDKILLIGNIDFFVLESFNLR